ncbi:anti-sigma B factor antagonist [Marinactinospora thermotolerans DSM 45154]|uniref:Anti-sigma factor antagonist n=2 Tax=Marinactinospora thermotolerans TaxID=531310 RepID=A0A1T4T3F6_9ACTN|nr:anti-sigma B factor antagonist [Marinactinospora thermotolerans DSM 45154]
MVAIRGEIDLYTAPRLHDELIGALDGGASRLIADLSGVDFCDSTGINVLLSAMKRAREKGGDLVLVAPRPAVTKILQITGLDAVFTVHTSADTLPVAAGSGVTS